MKLVFMYGGPGVGNLTTAQALAALTGFKLFHNHLSFNLGPRALEHHVGHPGADDARDRQLGAREGVPS